MYSIAYLEDQPIKRLKQIAKDFSLPNYSKITRANRAQWEKLIHGACEQSQLRRKLVRACTRSQSQRTGSGFREFSAAAAVTTIAAKRTNPPELVTLPFPIAPFENTTAIANEILAEQAATELADFRTDLARRRRNEKVDRAIRTVQQPEPALIELFVFFAVALLAMVEGLIALGALAFTLGKTARCWVAAEQPEPAAELNLATA